MTCPPQVLALLLLAADGRPAAPAPPEPAWSVPLSHAGGVLLGMGLSDLV